MKKPYQKQKLNFFAIITTLIFSVFIGQNSFAETPTYCDDVTNETELLVCIQNGQDVVLGANITVDNFVLVYSQDITIDLNDHYILRDGDGDFPIFAVMQSNLTILGPGMIQSISGVYPLILIEGSEDSADTDYTTVTIGENVVVKNISDTAITIGCNDNSHHGITLNMYGTADGVHGIEVKDTGANIENAPAINIMDGAKIIGSDMAIRAEGYAVWEIGEATIKGDTGIALKAGKFYLNGPNVTATGEDNAPHHGYSMDKSADVTRTEFVTTGTALQIHENETFSDTIEIFVNGGTYVSEKGFSFCEYKERAEDPDPTIITDTLKTFLIYDGDFLSFSTFDDISEVDMANVGMATEDFYWIYGDGRLTADGSASIKSYDPDWLRTHLIIRRFGRISGLDKIYRDASWIERLLIDYTSFDGPYYPTDFTDAQNVALDEYAISKGIDYEDIIIARYAQIDPYRFESDFESESGLLGAGKPYTIIRDLGEDYPLTFTMPIPYDDLPEIAEGYERKLKVLNFECWMEPGEHGGTEQCKLHEIPVTVSGDEYTFTTRYFSGFILSYDDEKVTPKVPDTGYNTADGAGLTVAGTGVIAAITIIGAAVYIFKKA